MCFTSIIGSTHLKGRTYCIGFFLPPQLTKPTVSIPISRKGLSESSNPAARAGVSGNTGVFPGKGLAKIPSFSYNGRDWTGRPVSRRRTHGKRAGSPPAPPEKENHGQKADFSGYRRHTDRSRPQHTARKRLSGDPGGPRGRPPGIPGLRPVPVPRLPGGRRPHRGHPEHPGLPAQRPGGRPQAPHAADPAAARCSTTTP